MIKQEQTLAKREAVLKVIQRKLDEVSQRAEKAWLKAHEDHYYDGSGELAGITGSLKGLADALKDIVSEEEC